MKQTAVEWQHVELMRINFEYGTMKISPREFQEQTKDILDKAKEMEKQQNEETFNQSRLAKIFEKDMPPFWGSWERYYNEAFKSDKMEKQETLEEAAEKYAEENAKDGNISYHNLYAPLEYAFRNGAKWMAEQMYSEEEVDKLLDTLLHNNMCSVAGDELIKQFKKK
jgi:paraquat-inducible protein B